MRLAGKAFQKCGCEPRFANAGLAGEKHHLTFAVFCFCPAPQQQFRFFFPTHEGGQTARVQRLEATFHRTCRNTRRARIRGCP
jgi:hypothetical protein